MKKTFFFFLLSLILAACSPSEGAIQTAIAETEAAKPTHTSTVVPTNTPTPLEPTITPEPKISCEPVDVEEFLENINLSIEEWNDVYKRAEATSRVNLSPVIGELQEIRRDTRRSDSPECGEFIKDLIIISMGQTIESFLAFSSQASDEEVANMFAISDLAWNYTNENLGIFREDAINAYLVAVLDSLSSSEKTDTQVVFELPDGWKDNHIPFTEILFSVPDNWTHKIDGDVIRFEDKVADHLNKTSVNMALLDDGLLTGLSSDIGRLFALRIHLPSQGFSQYVEKEYYYDIYSANKVYSVLFETTGKGHAFSRDGIGVILITPENEVISLFAYPGKNRFTETEIITLYKIFESFR